ncbi:hypothetical protein O0544_01985 [Edwardsiella anguillarum]|nr:hypothetical protein [Edwardsiella anguillarum]
MAGEFDAGDLLPAPIAGVGGADDALYLQLSNGMRLLPAHRSAKACASSRLRPAASRWRVDCALFYPLHSR